MPNTLVLGPLLIPVPALGLVTGFYSAAWLLGRIAPRLGMEARWARHTLELSMLVGVVAARLWFVAVNWTAYWDAPLSILYVWQPGYSMGAGVTAGLAFAASRLHRKRGLWRRQSVIMLASGAATTAIAFYLIVGLAWLTRTNDPVGPGAAVADFELEDLDGAAVRWSDLAGSVVLLNFWATWCPPCRREMPLLQTVNEQYRDRGVQVVGVAVGESADTVRTYVDTIGVTYPIWVGGGDDGRRRTQALFDTYGGAGLPTTLFVDRDGVIRRSYIGELSRGFIDSELKRLVSEADQRKE